MKDFMRYIATGCISFTFSCIFYLLCSFSGIFPPIIEQMVIDMMFISIAIISLIYLSHLLPIETPVLARLLELILVLLVLIFAGSLLNLFPFTLYIMLPILTIGVLTYLAVIIVIFIGDQASANRINAVIQNRKTEGFHD